MKSLIMIMMVLVNHFNQWMIVLFFLKLSYHSRLKYILAKKKLHKYALFLFHCIMSLQNQNRWARGWIYQIVLFESSYVCIMRNTDFEVILVDEDLEDSAGSGSFDECAICLENYKLHCFYTLKPCKHHFCFNCITVLKEYHQRLTCPLCRQDIEAYLNVSLLYKTLLRHSVQF